VDLILGIESKEVAQQLAPSFVGDFIPAWID